MGGFPPTRRRWHAVRTRFLRGGEGRAALGPRHEVVGGTAMAERARAGTMTSITLPRADGSLESFELGAPGSWPRPVRPFRSRVAYAAAHVVCDPLADVDVLADSRIDW